MLSTGYSLKKKKKNRLDFISSSMWRSSIQNLSNLEDMLSPVDHSFQVWNNRKYFPNRKPGHEIILLSNWTMGKLSLPHLNLMSFLIGIDLPHLWIGSSLTWWNITCEQQKSVGIVTGRNQRLLIGHQVPNSIISNSKARRKSITLNVLKNIKIKNKRFKGVAV